MSVRTRTPIFTSPSQSRFQRPVVTSSQSLPISAARPLIFSNKSPPQVEREILGPTTSKKRSFSEIIDLIIDDEDFQPSEPIERKKSRSSSYSSIETRTEIPGIVERVSSKLGNSFFPPLLKHYKTLDSPFQ